MTARNVRAAIAIAAAGLMVATPASAQLSRIKKAATDKAKEAVGAKEAPKPAAEAASRDYAITTERVDLMLKALAPAVQKAEREQALKTMRTDYEAKSKALETCMSAASSARVATAMVAPDQAAIEKATKITMRTSDLAQRAAPAQAAGRYKEMLAIQDTMTVLGIESSMAMLGITKCGSMVYKPAAMLEADAAQMAHSNSGSAATRGTVIDASNRGGLTYQQFGMIRERIAVWALQQTGNAKPNDSKYATYTDAEHAALNTRVAELKKLAPLFKGGTLGWSSWNDLAEW